MVSSRFVSPAHVAYAPGASFTASRPHQCAAHAAAARVAYLTARTDGPPNGQTDGPPNGLDGRPA